MHREPLLYAREIVDFIVIWYATRSPRSPTPRSRVFNREAVADRFATDRLLAKPDIMGVQLWARHGNRARLVRWY